MSKNTGLGHGWHYGSEKSITGNATIDEVVTFLEPSADEGREAKGGEAGASDNGEVGDPSAGIWKPSEEAGERAFEGLRGPPGSKSVQIGPPRGTTSTGQGQCLVR